MLIKNFHDVEKDSNLFDITDATGYPIWDILRYSVFLSYYYPEKVIKRLNIKTPKSKTQFLLFTREFVRFFFRMIFLKKGKILIQTASRFKKGENKYYDRSSIAIIELLKDNKVVLETNLREKYEYETIYDFSFFSRRFYRSQDLNIEIYDRVSSAFKKKIGKFSLTYEDINSVYHRFQSDVFFYSILLKRIVPKKIFTSVGNPKAIIWVARSRKIPIYLLQHAGILYEEVEYSYPAFVETSANVLFADVLFTFGSYWGKDLNIPVKKIEALGNDYYYFNKREENTQNNILVISTIVHGEFLSQLVLEYSRLHPELYFVFKLHPDEYHLTDYYYNYFKKNKNVKVSVDEFDTRDLILQSKLVILIVSTVIYEALNQNKKIAIYKKLNYERNNHLSSFDNVYFFEDTCQLDIILNKKIKADSANQVKFYSPFKESIIQKYI